jgi:hypothetical protein
MPLDAEKQTDFNASILRRGHHVWTQAHFSDDGSLQVKVRVWSENMLLGYRATSLVVFLDETTRIQGRSEISVIDVDARGNPFGMAERTEHHTEAISLELCGKTTRLEIVHLNTTSFLIEQAIDGLINEGGTFLDLSTRISRAYE